MCKIFVLLLLIGGNAYCQWIKISPNLLPPIYYSGFAEGTISYKDGILWAGSQDQLFSSIDLGNTWQKKAFPGHDIFDIIFYDKLIGLTCGLGDVYMTSDGGQTWKSIFWHRGITIRAYFNGSPDIIHVLSCEPDDMLFTTTDAGGTWFNSPILGDKGLCFAISANKDIYIYIPLIPILLM